MAGEIRRLKFSEGVTVTSPINYSFISGLSGTVNLSLGDSSKTVTFATAWIDVNYNPIVSILCDDANPIFVNCVIQNKTVNGFDVKFNSPMDSNNYKLTYVIGA